MMKEALPLAFEDLPKDNRFWWVRWVDDIYLRHAGTGTAGVVAFISPLRMAPEKVKPGDIISIWREGKTNPEEVISKVLFHTGSIPGLVMGAVFRNGRIEGYLPTSEEGELEIGWDGASARPVLSPLSMRLDAKPSWSRKEDMDYRLLGHWEYPLLGARNRRWCLPVRQGECLYIIPCGEIFRTFYAWHTKLALAITNGPWHQHYTKVATKRDENGILCLKAAIGFELDDCPRLAALILDPNGFRAASEIFVEGNNQGLDGKVAPACIKADLPFSDRPWKIRVKGSFVHHDGKEKFLVQEILGWDWPYANSKWKADLAASNLQGVEIIPTTRRAPFGGGTTPIEPAGIESGFDPLEVRTLAVFEAPSFQVKGVTLERPEKEVSMHYLLRPMPGVEKVSKQPTSTGNPARSGDGRPGGLIEPGRNAVPSRFRLVIEAFHCLRNDKLVEDFGVIGPPVRGRDLPHGIEAWRMPAMTDQEGGKLISWCSLEVEGKKRRRLALVIEARLKGKTVCFLELEQRRTEQFKALGFCYWIDRSKAVNRILRLAVAREGIWGADVGTALASELASVRPWKHVYNHKGHGELNTKSLAKFLAGMAVPTYTESVAQGVDSHHK